MNRKLAIKIYHGFGHTRDIVVYGHVFRKKATLSSTYSDKWLLNLFRLLRLFFVKPVGHVPLTLLWEGKRLETRSEPDGFFRFEWASEHPTRAGWHAVSVTALDEGGNAAATGEGRVLITHRTQYGFISDIDDTILKSHSVSTLRRLKELFKHPRHRNIFADTVRFYRLAALSNTTPDAPNPFFYISSSEWNLYDYLRDVFEFHRFPDGVFLLNQVKRWYEIFKTGKTKHEGKLLRILRVLEVFPNQQFILLGDNSQQDPVIYGRFVDKYPGRIVAVYIRNVRKERETETLALLESFEQKGVRTLLFSHSEEAIHHGRNIGIISQFENVPM